LVDSSKFRTQSGTIVCGLDEIDTIITDAMPTDLRTAIEQAGVKVIIV